MTQLKCPKCGRRVIDTENGVKTEIRVIQDQIDWVPDFYTKCWKCKTELGIKKN